MYETFATWDDVLVFVKRGGWLFYHAPLDFRPSSVQASVRGKGRKIRITPGGDCDPFWADEKHLPRMRRQKR